MQLQIQRTEPEISAIDSCPVCKGDDVTASSHRRNSELELPSLTRLVYDLEPLDSTLCTGRPAGKLLRLVDLEIPDVLVVLA